MFINYATGEIILKIVYYGTGLCGKTTNLKYIHESSPQGAASKLLSLATQTDRTLFFDLLPLDVGTLAGMKIKLQLYTVPGQVFYNSTRQMVLKGADGVVFVVDSQRPLLPANEESLQNLKDNLREIGASYDEVPLVMQYNKRDLPDLLSVPDLERSLNDRRVPHFPAQAARGVGVTETLREITRQVLKKLPFAVDDERRSAEAPAAAPARAAAAAAEPEELTAGWGQELDLDGGNLLGLEESGSLGLDEVPELGGLDAPGQEAAAEPSVEEPALPASIESAFDEESMGVELSDDDLSGGLVAEAAAIEESDDDEEDDEAQSAAVRDLVAAMASSPTAGSAFETVQLPTSDVSRLMAESGEDEAGVDTGEDAGFADLAADEASSAAPEPGEAPALGETASLDQEIVMEEEIDAGYPLSEPRAEIAPFEEEVTASAGGGDEMEPAAEAEPSEEPASFLNVEVDEVAPAPELAVEEDGLGGEELAIVAEEPPDPSSAAAGGDVEEAPGELLEEAAMEPDGAAAADIEMMLAEEPGAEVSAEDAADLVAAEESEPTEFEVEPAEVEPVDVETELPESARAEEPVHLAFGEPGPARSTVDVAATRERATLSIPRDSFLEDAHGPTIKLPEAEDGQAPPPMPAGEVRLAYDGPLYQGSRFTLHLMASGPPELCRGLHVGLLGDAERLGLLGAPMQRTGAPKMRAGFALAAATEGWHRAQAIVLSEGRFLARASCELFVFPKHHLDEPYVTYAEPPAALLDTRFPQHAHDLIVSLLCDRVGDEYRVSYLVWEKSSGVMQVPRPLNLSSSLVSQGRRAIASIATAHPDHRERNMIAAGTALRQLLPPELQEILAAESRGIDSVLVAAEDGFIPWEILRPNGDALPLGARFRLGQWPGSLAPRGDIARKAALALLDRDDAPPPLLPEDATVCHSREAALFSLVGKPLDLVAIRGVGGLDPELPAFTYVELKDGHLQAADLTSLSGELKEGRPWVLLDPVLADDATTRQDSGIAAWASALIARLGAGGLAGPRVALPRAQGQAAWAHVSQLLTGGMTIGAALREVRRAALSEPDADLGLATFALYGDPDARLA